MKRILLSTISILALIGLHAQTTDLGGPISWKRNFGDTKQIPVEVMTGFDLEAIRAEDAVNDQHKDIPWRFGYKYDTDINLSNSGKWIDLSGGNRLWRTRISCSGAMTINLLLKNVYLPEGARLYLFDSENTNRVGAYTSRNNRADGELGTELVHGDEIFVEYYEPANVHGQGRFTIANVIHGYRSLDRVQSDLIKSLNSSGDCNIDVHCPLGNGWENQIRSVAMIVVGGSGICSGALINNTCNDGTPYFLTANHCLGSSTGNWAFRFNWASPPGTESCATTAGSTDPGPPYDETANGATVLVSGTEADYAFLQIDNMTVTDAQNWNLFYSGWNNDDTDGSITQATAIHHPSGDVMKICQDQDGPYHSTSGAAAVWWIDQYEEGVTEPGSSGSPLFDQNGRIIGQLYGGSAACSGTVNNGQYDYYGRFGVSWGYGISDYLAPTACGGTVTINDGWDPNGPAQPDNASIQIILSPKGLSCEDGITPKVQLRNAGGNNLTSCTINYNIDGGTNSTYSWTGNLASFATEVVTLPVMTAGAGTHVFNAFTSNPNGTTDTDPSNDAAAGNFDIQTGGFETILNLTTDCYGQETYWEIRDGGNNLINSGGNTNGIPPGGQNVASNSDPGAYADNILINVKMCLAEGCYDFTIYDDYGDGMEGSSNWGCNNDGYYEILNSSGTVLGSMQNVNFGNSETINFCVANNLGISEIENNLIKLYPNPNNGEFIIDLSAFDDQIKQIQILDLNGRLIEQMETIKKEEKINLTNISTGVYHIEILVGNRLFNQRMIIK